MLKRLVIGLIKGALIGGALGAAFHFGLGWVRATGLLAFLIAMGTGATAGILAGSPPWKQQGWIESVLKSVAGLAIGALSYWGLNSFASVTLPISIDGLAGVPWTESTLFFPIVIAALFGSLVELDNTDEAPPAARNSKRPNVRVGDAEQVEVVNAEVIGSAEQSK